LINYYKINEYDKEKKIVGEKEENKIQNTLGKSV
jgi:hypothetical protein